MTRWLLASFALIVIGAVIGYVRQADDLPGLGDWLAPRDELTVANGG